MADSSAKGEKGVGINAFADKPVGVERLGLGPQFRPAVGEVNTRRSHTARRYLIRPNPGGLFEIASYDRNNRIESSRLLDGRIEICKLGHMLGLYGTPSDYALEFGANFFQHVRVL